MAHSVFLSHDHDDSELARVLAAALGRVTLRQLQVWFSSDSTASGGVRPGAIWVDELKTRLTTSRALLILLTPRSAARPWLLFESGFAAGLSTCEVIPVLVGLSASDVSFPLAMYQCYQLTGYQSLRDFVRKLVTLFDIDFDEEMTKPILEQAMTQLADLVAADASTIDRRPAPTLADLGETIKQHIDRRFVEMMESRSDLPEGFKPVNRPSYQTSIRLTDEPDVAPYRMEIHDRTMVYDVINDVYLMIASEVAPFTYMKTWMLEEVDTKLRLVVYEISRIILASPIFTPGSVWRVVRLDAPYSPLFKSQPALLMRRSVK